MKFVSALGWMLLGLCLGTMLSHVIGGPHPGTGHAYVQPQAQAEADATAAGNVFAAEIDSNASR
jgi:hypothetical protein